MATMADTVAAQIAAAQRDYQARLTSAQATNSVRTNAARTAATGSVATNPQQVIQQQAQAVQNLSYTPIDIEGLKRSATEQAATNAAGSLALEQNLAPGVASSREQLQKQVSDELALGGRLPADVQARVGRTSAAQAGSAGVLGSHAPATAAALGLTSLDLANSRRAAASNLLAANPLPQSGLDPGAVAGLSVADTNAKNQFALSKLGAGANLAQSQLGVFGADQANKSAQQNIDAATNVPTTISAMPYIPLSSTNRPQIGLDGKPINPNATSLYDQYAAQRKQTTAQAAGSPYFLSPTKLGPGY